MMENSTNQPYNTSFSQSSPELNMPVKNQIEKYKKEEQENKSPRQLKHTLHQSSVTQVGNIVIQMMNFRNTILAAEKQIVEVDKREIDKIHAIVDNIIGQLTTDLTNSLDKLAI